MQSQEQQAARQPLQPRFSALASLSQFGGYESTLIASALIGLANWLFLWSSLHPSVGTLGAILAIATATLLVVHLTRPVVLWCIGRWVYRSLVVHCGQEAATKVATIYSTGGSITDCQLHALVGRNTETQSLASSDAP